MALILGESHDSGQDSGWDGSGKKTTIPNEFRESSWRVSRIEFRADNGRFCENGLFPQPLSRREVPCAILPSLFLENICCPPLIMGEYYNSGQGLGFDRRAC